MRRTLQPLLAATAGLSLFLAACSGESPTSPKTPTDTGNGGGTCTVTMTIDATSVTPMAGTAIVLRATVKKGGSAVPDGTSVLFTTDFGFFLETGLPSVSKVTQNGFADVTLGATAAGLAKVKATFECGSADKSIEYRAVPTNGPFISSIEPTSGSCAGGDSVTINGGRFGTSTTAVRVLFGGLPASIQSLTDTKILVLTPTKSLANPLVPEAVDVAVQFYSGDVPTGTVTASKAFTYYCVDPSKRLSLSAIAPNSGSPDGGQAVTISGNNLLPSPASSIATTRVTFGGASASVTGVTNTSISVLTPRHALANPAVPEAVDVAVLVDLGLVSQQSGLIANGFTYRAGGGTGQCTGTSGLFIATVQPESTTNPGSPDGGDIVTITGGGFTAGGTSTQPERTAVYFGGNQGVTLSVTDSQVRVATPRHVLSSPDKPDTVDVKVVVDAGGPKEACVQATSAYTYYPGGYLEPAVTSISPSSGPNDASTRVTMFGRNFKLPMQVFVGSVEASVVEIKASQIIFLTPIATGPNSFLAGQTVDVVVRDPYTGKEFPSSVRFRYYSCPSVNSVVPASAPWNQSTVVTIAGQAFEEPIEASWTVGAGGSGGSLLIRPSVTSVSSSLITLVMPAIDPATGGSPNCANLAGTLTLSLPSTTCGPIDVPFTYRVDAMTAVSATPTQLNQSGGPFGSPLTGPPATITVTGTNFIDPMTVEIYGGNGASIKVNNAVVANSSQLTFLAPAVLDTQLNTQPCVPAGGTSVTGTRYVPTSFGIRLRNARTGCTVELPNILIYNPASTQCRAPITVTGTPVATATLCSAYGPVTFTAAGGTPQYNFTVSGLPPGVGFTPNPATNTVTISGTPHLMSAGAGQASQAFPVTIAVTDASTPALSGSTSYTLVMNDPGAPYAITGPTTWAVNASASSIGFAIAPASTPFATTWTVAAPVAGVTLTPAGNTATLSVGAGPGAPTGDFSITLQATDSTCAGSPSHTASIIINATVTGR